LFNFLVRVVLNLHWLIASLCATNGCRHGFIRSDINPSERPLYRAVNRMYLIQGSRTKGNHCNGFTDQRLTTCTDSTGGSLEENSIKIQNSDMMAKAFALFFAHTDRDPPPGTQKRPFEPFKKVHREHPPPPPSHLDADTPTGDEKSCCLSRRKRHMHKIFHNTRRLLESFT
jgi:hypothetical protein